MMRKGLTPIIAMVLLLMLAIAAGGMLFVFAQKMQSSLQENVQKEMLSEAERQAMRVAIVSVYKTSEGKIGVAVRNIGRKDIPTDYISLYLNGQPVSDVTFNCDGTIQVFKTCGLKLDNMDFPGDGERFTIRVDAPGNTDTKVCKSEGGMCVPP